MAPIRTNGRSDGGASGTDWSSGSSSYGSQDNDLNCCTVCGAKVGRIHDLKRHMKIHEPKDKRCTYSADCKYVTRTEALLRTHMRRHEDDRRFSCTDDVENCHYSSIDAAGLLRHRVTHHGYKPRKYTRQKRKPASHRVPVSIASHLVDNDDEVAKDNFGVYRTGIKPGRRDDSDEEIDQLDSSSDESTSPRSPSGSGSASGYSSPSTPSDNDAMVHYMVNQGNVCVPQVYYERKPEMSLLDAALVKYPFSSQLLAVPPFLDAQPADQSLLSFQGWNAEPQVKLEVIEPKDFKVPGQVAHELYSFVVQEDKYMAAGPSNVVQLEDPQAASNFPEYINYPTNESGYIDFGTIVSESYLDTLPVEGLQSLSVNLGSHDDWMIDNNDVYPSAALDTFGNPVNFDFPSINDDTSSFGQVYECESDFSSEASLENFDFLSSYSNTSQDSMQPYY